MKSSGTSSQPPDTFQQTKVVLLGEQGVGKSCIAVRFASGEFLEKNEATIGAMFITQTIPYKGVRIKFDIWDTAGQERYRTLAPMYYRNAQAAVVVYDITDANSFLRAVSWIDELKRQATADIFIVLAGNKADLSDSSRVVDVDDAQQLASEHGLIFFETSAKSGQGISEVFQAIANDLARKPPSKHEPVGAVRLSERNSAQKKCTCRS